MNPQEKEERGHQREEKNHEEKRKEKSDKPSRLGREAKIGVVVILLLLGTFAAVVAVKMTKGDSDDKQLARADHDGGKKHKPPLAANGDDLFKGVSAKSFGRQPTMVPPARAASTALPGGIDSKLDKWKLPSERNASRQVVSRYGAPLAPPSFVADPPKPARGGRYGSAAKDSLPGLEAEKPRHFGQKAKDLSPPPPEVNVKKRSAHADSVAAAMTRGSFERSESSGFADAGGPPAAHHEKSRYEPSAALMAPEPPRERPSYDRGGRSFAGSTRRQHNDDFPRASAPPSYEREKPSHKDGEGRSFAGSTRRQYDDDFPRASAPPSYERERPDRYDAPSFGSRSPRRRDGKYEVQPGDSYWTISERIYGSGAYYQALAEQNRGKVGSSDRLTPGDVIVTPSVAQLASTYPELCPKPGRRETQESRTMAVSTRRSYRGGRSYTVTEGDTLFNIARYELGKAGRWVEIYDLNRDVLGKDYNYLTPGMKLVLPDNEKGDVMARRSGDLNR